MYLPMSWWRFAIREQVDGNMAEARRWLSAYAEALERLRPGDALAFGCHLATGMTKPIPEDSIRLPILWEVLDRQGDELLLVSRFLLDWEFFDEDTNRWEESWLRREMNFVMQERWFSPWERACLCAEPDPVFLLSRGEAERYFSRPGSASAAMIYQERTASGIPYLDEWVNAWWLRTPAEDEYSVMVVDRDGTVCEEGVGIGADEIGIRPAIRLSISRVRNIMDAEIPL